MKELEQYLQEDGQIVAFAKFRCYKEDESFISPARVIHDGNWYIDVKSGIPCPFCGTDHWISSTLPIQSKLKPESYSSAKTIINQVFAAGGVEHSNWTEEDYERAIRTMIED